MINLLSNRKEVSSINHFVMMLINMTFQLKVELILSAEISDDKKYYPETFYI